MTEKNASAVIVNAVRKRKALFRAGSDAACLRMSLTLKRVFYTGRGVFGFQAGAGGSGFFGLPQSDRRMAAKPLLCSGEATPRIFAVDKGESRFQLSGP